MLSLFQHTHPASRFFTQIRTCKCKAKDLVIIPKEEIKRYVVDCIVASGASKENACFLATVLVAADEKGYYSHGINRLEMYANDLKKCLVDGKATPKIVKETPATAWVDGNNAMGAVVGHFCMELAIKKAKKVGVGWIVANQSNHYGIASIYTIPMMKEGLVGISCTNTSPVMAPFGAKQAALGSNPLSVAAPSKDCGRFVFDMATTAVAKGKIEQALREGKKIPVGWCQDAEGNPLTDPEEALDSGSLLPLGGHEEGTKGTGLAMVIETLCGILGGSNYSSRIPRWGKTEDKANLGHCFVGVDIKCFAPCFEERMGDFLDIIRSLDPVKPDKKMMVPGEPESIHMKKVAEQGGIEYSKEEKERFDCFAEELGVKPMQPLKK